MKLNGSGPIQYQSIMEVAQFPIIIDSPHKIVQNS